MVLNNLANLPQLVFEVTDACNLKCKYCAYGELYGFCDKRENQKLSIAKAKRIIDYLCAFWNSERVTSATPLTYISFYGGEPLLNLPFIEEIVDYIKTGIHCPDRKFVFSMTTNGTLLNQCMDFLAENEFALLVSLDGNQKNNGYRVDHNGKESFSKVVENVDLLRERFPEYFKKHVNFNSVFHNLSTMEEVYSFFKQRYDKVPAINEMNDSCVRRDKVKLFEMMYNETVESLHQSPDHLKIENDMSFNGHGYRDFSLYVMRYSGNYFDRYTDLLCDRSNSTLIPTGTCIPFAKKMFVTVNGKILPCERIGHQFGLGQITDTSVELSSESIALKYNTYYSKVDKRCASCKIRKACSQCYFNMESAETNPVCLEFRTEKDMEELVEKQLDFLRQHPKAYREIMEEMTFI